MKELQELAFIFNKHRIAKIEIIGDDSRRQDSKMYQLFEAVRGGEVKTDMEAASLLYSSPEISAKYRNLKSQLKKRLFNTTFFLDDGTNEREVAYYECWKDWALCNILMHKDARFTVPRLAEKILKKASKYEFHDLILPAALYLRSYYGRGKKDKKQFEYYNELYYTYKKIEYAFNLANEYYMKLILDYAAKGVVHDPRIRTASEAYYQELLPLTKEISSDRFHYRLIQIRLLGAMGTYDYRLAKTICEEGLARQQQSDNPFKGGIRNLLLNKLACHTQLKEYEAGRITALECEQLLKEGEFTWFKAKEHFFMLSIHIGAYQEAYETYEAITKHKRFKRFKDNFGETWILYRQYLHFLVLSNKIVPHKKDKTYNNIRLGRFLNQVPSFSTDKQGMNIPVLIIQLSILILQKKYDAAEERIDALSKYLARYVKRSSSNYRCHHFIKLLMEVPIAGFQRKLVERKAKKHLQKMQLVEMDFDSQSHEVEVLPFMRLWEMVVILLK